MPLQWRKQMSVGNLIIDQDHRYLLCLVNLVEFALHHPEERDHLKGALEQLAEYTREHFAREERIQYAIRYPHYIDHKMAHQKLFGRLEELAERILAEEAASIVQDNAAEITQLLRDWLLDHVLKEDMLMKQHLQPHPPNFLG